MLRIAAAIAVAWYALYFFLERIVAVVFGGVDLDLWRQVALVARGMS